MAGVAEDFAAKIVVGMAAAIAIAIISYGLIAAHILTMAVRIQSYQCKSPVSCKPSKHVAHAALTALLNQCILGGSRACRPSMANPQAGRPYVVAITVCSAAQQVGAWMLWSTWPLVIAIREDRVQDHPLFSYDDAEGASQALFPKSDSGAAAEV